LTFARVVTDLPPKRRWQRAAPSAGGLNSPHHHASDILNLTVGIACLDYRSCVAAGRNSTHRLQQRDSTHKALGAAPSAREVPRRPCRGEGWHWRSFRGQGGLWGTLGFVRALQPTCPAHAPPVVPAAPWPSRCDVAIVAPNAEEPQLRSPHELARQRPLSSEPFRSASSTCRPLCGKLSVRESDRMRGCDWSLLGTGEGPCSM